MRYGVLGPLEVVGDDGPITVPGQKERTVLALLIARANSVVSVSALVDALWGNDPPLTAGKTLQGYVMRLRRAIDADAAGGVIVTRDPGYLLRTSRSDIDAPRFEMLVSQGREALAAGDATTAARLLREAAQLWRGEAYGEFLGSAFAAAESERLTELRRSAVEARIDADLAQGGHAQLVAELEALVVELPLREPLWAQLMLALYRSGRQADALDAYRRARDVLIDELGIEPTRMLRELHGKVLAQDPSLDLQPTLAVAPAAGGHLHDASGTIVVTLSGDRRTIGKDSGNDVALPDDPTVSRMHAALERYPAGWCVADLGSSNGTFVNGERIWGPRRLRDGDEVRVGRTTLMYVGDDAPATVTELAVETPPLTDVQRELLQELCGPLLETDLFAEPAPVAEVAAALRLPVEVVEERLGELCAVFDIDAPPAQRAARLASTAVQRGVVLP